MKTRIILIATSSTLISCSDHVGFRLSARISKEEANCILSDKTFKLSYDKKTHEKTDTGSHNNVSYDIMTLIEQDSIHFEISWSKKTAQILFKNNGESSIKKDALIILKNTSHCLKIKSFQCKNLSLEPSYYHQFCTTNNDPDFWFNLNI